MAIEQNYINMANACYVDVANAYYFDVAITWANATLTSHLEHLHHCRVDDDDIVRMPFTGQGIAHKRDDTIVQPLRWL